MVRDDIVKYHVNPLSVILLEHLIKSPPNENSGLSYGAIRSILRTYGTMPSNKDLIEITDYLSGERAKALTIFFIYNAPDGEDYIFSADDIIKAESLGFLPHPKTKTPITDYKKHTFIHYAPHPELFS